MALDLGDQRIGVALSDALGMFARPLMVIKRTSRANDFNTYKKLIAEYKVQTIIAGLPINMNGSEGKQAHWVRDYVAEFSKAVDIPVRLWDERLTTETAREIMKDSGRHAGKNEIDAVAAAVILQSYLDEHRN
jgi:putative Holliday junction resolvase